VALVLATISYRKGHKPSLFLIPLMLSTLVVELIAEFCYKKGIDFTWAMHVFVVLEYSLFCLYYLQAVANPKGKKIVARSIVLFMVFSLSVSYFFYQFRAMPGINITTEGFLLFIIFTHLLFNLDTAMQLPIYKHANFWIATGVLAFFGGASLFFGVYTPLLNIDTKKALSLFGAIVQPLNLLFYSCIIVGLLFTIWKWKSTTRSY
jgi:hypothetical protein